MAQIGVDPAGNLTLDGQILSRYDPRLWGSRGYQQGRREVADPAQAGNDAGSLMMWVDPTEGWAGLQATGRHQLGSAGLSSGQEGQGFGEFNINHIADLQYDPEYGITTSNPSFIDSANDPDDRARMHRARAAIITAMAAGAGYSAFGGAGAGAEGAAGLATDIAPGYLAESVAPQVTEVMAGSPWNIPVGPMLQESVAPQVTEVMSGNPFLTPTIPVDPMLEESVAPQVTETMSGSPFSENWLDQLRDLGSDLLGGGKGGGTNPVLAALTGAAGKIGDHRQDTDPYGLQASGYGPWKGLTDDPKAKVVDAMMKRKQDSIWS